ncbi:UNVERIFIED_CONTAM: hypothetical protein FKN15_060402 [Acipenser sinensis]
MATYMESDNGSDEDFEVGSEDFDTSDSDADDEEDVETRTAGDWVFITDPYHDASPPSFDFAPVYTDVHPAVELESLHSPLGCFLAFVPEKLITYLTNLTAMRAMCKEEDYAFLRSLDERRQVLSDEIQQVQKELEERHEEQVQRRHQMERREKERQRELEEMQKAMRAMCKEEDYAFLRSLDERRQVLSDEIQQVQKELEERHEEQVQRRHQMERREKERQRELEEMQKEKQEQWRNQAATRAAAQERALRERADRLKQFRQFLTQLRRTEGSVGVLRSHDRANFLFCTQELESYRPALQVSALSSLGAWLDFQRQVLEEELGLSSGENSKKTADTKPGLQGEASPDLQRTTSTSTESTAPAPEHPVRNRVGSELLFRDCNPLVLLLVIPIAG